MQGDGFQVKTTVKIDGRNNISEEEGLARLQDKGTHCRVGTMPDTPPAAIVSLFSCTLLPAAEPFIPAPFGSDVGSAVCSVRDIGKEREVGDINTLAWAAVVGSASDSMAGGD